MKGTLFHITHKFKLSFNPLASKQEIKLRAGACYFTDVVKRVAKMCGICTGQITDFFVIQL